MKETKTSNHLQRKIKFINKTPDSQDYESLQDLATIDNNSSFYWLKEKNQNRDCYRSKRGEDKILEDILDGKEYNEMYEDLYGEEYIESSGNCIDLIDMLDNENYLLERYGYDIKSQSFVDKENKNNG